MEEIIVYFAVKYKGDWESIYQAISKKERVDMDEVKKTVASLKTKWVTIISKDYPNSLKQIPKPPFVLFYKGNFDLLFQKSIAVIGSRNATKYGISACEKIVKDLVETEYCIVSGLAKGIDSCSHRTALKYFGKTIAVLGYGLNFKDEALQKEIIEKGLVISEYPEDVLPHKKHFLFRNRLISGLSSGVVVIEAKYKSGTMNTVAHGLEQNKEIFCVPNRINEQSGCNKLIKEGAKLVESGKDIIEDL
ncbi:MAG: DNA-protecting protein DprA [Erysipelotrichaceae bacterium]|nr:DNA-protecting protein DprA [Erysipelotrichaceae bacterium]